MYAQLDKQLFAAVMDKDLFNIIMLVSQGANPFQRRHGKSLLQSAINMGNIDMVKYFLSLGLPLTRDDYIIAIVSLRLEKFKWLVSQSDVPINGLYEELFRKLLYNHSSNLMRGTTPDYEFPDKGLYILEHIPLNRQKILMFVDILSRSVNDPDVIEALLWTYWGHITLIITRLSNEKQNLVFKGILDYGRRKNVYNILPQVQYFIDFNPPASINQDTLYSLTSYLDQASRALPNDLDIRETLEVVKRKYK